MIKLRVLLFWQKVFFVTIHVFIIIKYQDNIKYSNYLILDVKSVVKNKILSFEEKITFLHYHDIMHYIFNHEMYK